MNRILRILLCVSVVLLAPIASAAPPQTINYQGYLTNPGGTPVNSAVVMTFRLYNAASGGAAIYTETQLSVGVSNGSFNAIIGAVSPITLPFDVPYWLTVAINADAEMSPRQPLGSSPYAFRASSLANTATIAGTQITGNVPSADFASSAGSASVATTAMIAGALQGSLPGSQVSGAITSATLPAAQITGTIGATQLAATQRLPALACAANEIAQWNGTAWICGTATAGNNGDITGNLTMVNSTITAGNVVKGGALFMHNSGFESVYLGGNAGNLASTAGSNTGIGINNLTQVTTGFRNSALGNGALYRTTDGIQNTAVGTAALVQNVSGSNNTAVGDSALLLATGSSNIALGANAGSNIGLGPNNIAIGNTGDPMDANTMRLGSGGSQTRTFIAGITGVTPALSTLPVVIDSNGQLGTGAAAVGGVTSVATGVGLTGGPITSSGTINLAASQLLPTTLCAAGTIAKSNGAAWTCGVDNDTNSGGTVTSITASGGLATLVGAAVTPGGIITNTGTIVLNPTAAELTNNYFKFGGNTFSAIATIGSTNDVPVEVIANGVRVARFEHNPNAPNIALGHPANAASGGGATVGGGGWTGFPNLATANSATVAGGYDNKAQGGYTTVGGGNANTASGTFATVSGGALNTATSSSASVGGGSQNNASGSQSTISGGAGNNASGLRSTIAGGSQNNATVGDYQAMGGGRNNSASNTDVTVAGGVGNTASGPASSVGGGNGNIASGITATVSGGIFNTASGNWATVAGGDSNTALGDYSFAAGQRAKANAVGCFAWAGNNNIDFVCNTVNAFMALASGGVQFRTSGNLSTGCNIAAGGSGWTCTSSRETKKDFTAMDVVDVLTRVAKMPVTQWRYRTETSGARHIGPMAEDFHAAFGLGESDKAINSIDASGVALAAIQGLNQLVSKKDAEIQTQNKRIKILEDALAAIQSRLGMR